MASNEYSGIPHMARLRTTGRDGPVIDLLNKSGIFIRDPGWKPGISELKSGGVKIESQSMDDSWLVAGGYGPVEETFPVGFSSEQLAFRKEQLQRYLWQAEQYWLTSWERGACYIEVRLKEDSGVRYSRIKNGSFSIESSVFNDRVGLPDNSLVLEREPFWHDNIPGQRAGPFTNWVPNPSFEFWRDDGISHSRPSGWEELNVANRPVGWYISREDAKIAGPHHAIKIGFASHAGPGIWGLRAQTSWPGSPAAHTLRFWVRVTGASANSVFRVILNDSVPVTQATWNTATDYTGWVHLPVDAPVDGAGFYVVVLSWNLINAQATPGEAIVDRMMLTRGTWTEETWPGDFYMGCSTVWGWEDDEDFYTPKLIAAENWHFINHVDVDGVPGDVEAITRMTVDRLGYQYGADYNWPILKYWLFQRRIEPRVDTIKDSTRISLSADPEGYTGADYTKVGVQTSSESAITDFLVIAAMGWIGQVGFRVDGIQETEPYVGRYRVIMRARWDPYESQDEDLYVRLVYWIGSPENEVTLDTIVLSPSDYFLWYNLTPRDYMDWLPFKDQPASLGLKIEVYAFESSTVGQLIIDEVQLGPVDGGMVNIEFEESSPWWTGQALVLDSDLQTPLPVTIGSPGVDDWIRDSAFYDLAGDSTSALDSQTYNGIMYILVYDNNDTRAELYQYDEDGWALRANLPGDDLVFCLETFNGKLYIAGQSAGVGQLWHFTEQAGPIVSATAGQIVYDLHAFNGQMYAATPSGLHWGNPQTGAMTNLGAGTAGESLEVYKRKIYVLLEANGTLISYSPMAGITNHGAAPGGGAWYAAIREWNNLLWTYGAGGLHSWDGSTYALVWTTPVVATECFLQVYDGALYIGASDLTGTITYVWRTTDGVNFEDVAEYPSDALIGCMCRYDGRLFVGGGMPRRRLQGVYYSDTVANWHQNQVVKLHSVNYTGGAFSLMPRQTQRFYQRMEAINMSDGEAEAYMRRPTAQDDHRGPQTQFSISFDSRWRSLRSE